MAMEFSVIQYNDRTVLCTKIHNYAVLIQKILRFNLSVAFLKYVSIFILRESQTDPLVG